MDRYQNIVRFSTFGHSHVESLHVTRAVDSTDPIATYMGTGSGTTGGGNPAFTVFDFDEEYMVPLNAHVYIMDLEKSNANPEDKPVWYEQHDLIKEYGMKDMSPSSMMDLFTRMTNDDELAMKYEWNKSRRQTPTPPTNKKHWSKYLCLAASETFEKKDCYGKEHIEPFYEFNMGDIV
jgi:hypothetical protein